MPCLLLVAASLPATNARADDGSRIAELFETSFAHEAMGSAKAALDDVVHILKLDPRHYVGNLRAGWLQYTLEEHDLAVTYYRTAAELRPQAMEPLVGMMLPLMAKRRWREAAAAGERVLKRAPRSYLACSRLAFAYFSLGRYQSAEAMYRAMLEDYPSDTEMMLGLAWTRLRQGDKAEARRQFEAVLEIRRGNSNALAGIDALK